MAKPHDEALIKAMRADLHAAWTYIQTNFPNERLYAFGLFTSEEIASYFFPFACGEEGLLKVAAEYVAKGLNSNVEEAADGLRWSIADSPYHKRLSALSRCIAAELSKKPELYGVELAEAAVAREIRTRLNAAAEAIKSLEAEGLFGVGDERMNITLLIEADDGEDEFVLKWAKKLNPPQVFNAFKKIGEQPTVGSFTEFGTKKVYETARLACSEDRRLVATVSEDIACLFDVVEMKQLFCRPIPSRKDYAWLNGITISDDGSTIAIIGGTGPCWLSILRGKDWKDQIDVRMEWGPISIAAAPDATWFAVGLKDKTVRIFDGKGALTNSLVGHAAWPSGLAVNRDGTMLASIDEKTGIHLWRTSDWTLVRRIEVAADGLNFDPTGSLLATTWRYGGWIGNSDPQGQLLRIWDIETGTLIRELTVPGFQFIAARFSPDGKTIAAGVDSLDKISPQEAVLLDANTGSVLSRLRGPFDGIEDFVFLPEKNAIAFAARGHTCRPLLLWQLSE